MRIAFAGGRRIAGAIGGTEQAMHRLAAGDLDTAIPGADRSDEIGAMAGAIEVFREFATKAETRALIGSAEVFMGGSLCNVGGSAPVANRLQR